MRDGRALDVGHALPLALGEAGEGALRYRELGKFPRTPVRRALLSHTDLRRIRVKDVGARLRSLINAPLGEHLDVGELTGSGRLSLAALGAHGPFGSHSFPPFATPDCRLARVGRFCASVA